MPNACGVEAYKTACQYRLPTGSWGGRQQAAMVQQEEEKKSIKFSTEDALILKSQLGLLWNKLREMRR